MVCRAGGQRKAGPLGVGELHFARLACAPKSRPQTMRRAPRTARLGKLPGGALGRFGRADFRDQPPRAHAVVAGRVPAKSRDPRRDFCPKPRPGEKRGPHIDRHLTSRCCRTSSQIVVGHVVNDVRRCGGPMGSKRRQKADHMAFSANGSPLSATFFQCVVRLPMPTT